VGGTKTESETDLGHQLQTDFEAIESAYNCLKAVFGDAKLPVEVEVNNLGGQRTLTEYNRALTSLLQPRSNDLSTTSQARLQAGHSLRILDSKSPQDMAVVSALELPDIDDFIEGSLRSCFSDLEDLLTMHDIPYKRNKRLVRGLDYYCGTCFEVKQVASGPSSSLLGPS